MQMAQHSAAFRFVVVAHEQANADARDRKVIRDVDAGDDELRDLRIVDLAPHGIRQMVAQELRHSASAASVLDHRSSSSLSGPSSVSYPRSSARSMPPRNE